MAVFKCKMCGAPLELDVNATVVTCDYCGTQQTTPRYNDDRKITLFTRANHLRFSCEFDKAAGVYESMVTEFPDEAEIYWGLVLCKYGIEYVDDLNGKKIPTCHRTLPVSIMEDEDFQQACDYADADSKAIYRKEAKVIDGIQRKILQIAATESPYDIFICYKETDDMGKRTEDSIIAQDIYTQLIKDGYKVFFSRFSLRDVAGTQYEPYIYAALSSAKVMLAVGTKFEYYDSVWVKNEWSRFIAMMNDDPNKTLIPCFKNMDAYDIPREFKHMQALDMGSVTFFASLTSNIKRLVRQEKVFSREVRQPRPEEEMKKSMVKRIFICLENGDFERAHEFCEKVLNIEPENVQAYIGQLMIECRCKKFEDLEKCRKTFANSKAYKKIVMFADEALKNTLEDYLKTIKNRHEEQKKIIFQREEALRLKRRKRTRIATLILLVLFLVGYIFSVMWPSVILPQKTFQDIVAVSVGGSHTVALKSDGTVVATGRTEEGQCDVENWTNIKEISAGGNHTVGLKNSGSVVATSFTGDQNYYNDQCNVYEWVDIIQVSAGAGHTVGLKEDGTVLDTSNSSCIYWTDIVAISAGSYHTVGLKADGTVVATEFLGESAHYEGQCDVTEWTDIVEISAGAGHTVGLKKDGTVVATEYIGDPKHYYGQCEVSEWKDIVAISAGRDYTLGLKKDGTVVCTKIDKKAESYDGHCDVEDWSGIKAISANCDSFFAGYHTVGVKEDGTLVAVGFNGDKRCLVNSDIGIQLLKNEIDKVFGKSKKASETDVESETEKETEESTTLL